MNAFLGVAIQLLMRLAAWIVPSAQCRWMEAMSAELAAVRSITGSQWRCTQFATGCLVAAVRLRVAAACARVGTSNSLRTLTSSGALPQIVVGCVAVLIGVAYLVLVGAPWRMAIINVCATVIGLLSYFTFFRYVPRSREVGAVTIVAALLMLTTALFGVSVDGARRWAAVGTLALQPTLVLIPLVVMWFARMQSGATTSAIVLTAAAVAIQPDRAMAAALCAAVGAVAFNQRNASSGAAFVATLIALLVTLLRPDQLLAVPYVDHILWTAAETSVPLAMSLWVGCLAILLPALMHRSGPSRPVRAAFIACWAGVIGAAAVGAYPTPLVGYGGSAIIGYFICLLALGPIRLHNASGTNANEHARDSPMQRTMQAAAVSV